MKFKEISGRSRGRKVQGLEPPFCFYNPSFEWGYIVGTSPYPGLEVFGPALKMAVSASGNRPKTQNF